MDLSFTIANILPSENGYEIPRDSLPPDAAARAVQNELIYDGAPELNLAGFHTTYMEPPIEEIMMANLPKNITHEAVYTAANAIEKRCVDMISGLFHSPNTEDESGRKSAIGVSTAGSSEACFLAIYGAKRIWQARRRSQGLDVSEMPNLVMSPHVHVCWKKAVQMLDIEPRYCASASHDSVAICPADAVRLVDENTVLVCATLGSLFTGEYDDISRLDSLLQGRNAELGIDVGVHVDAASGGFVAPFMEPERCWDFRLPLVRSINVSGHKFGQVYSSVGWAIWRSPDFLPKESLAFSVDYCGAPQISFKINFSQAANPVIGQYYQLIRLGFNGYRDLMVSLTTTADRLLQAVSNICAADGMKMFRTLSRRDGCGLPVAAWTLNKNQAFDEYDIGLYLRTKGWIVSVFTTEGETANMQVIRVIVKVQFTNSLCDTFVKHLQQVLEQLRQRYKSAEEAINDGDI